MNFRNIFTKPLKYVPFTCITSVPFVSFLTTVRYLIFSCDVKVLKEILTEHWRAEAFLGLQVYGADDQIKFNFMFF